MRAGLQVSTDERTRALLVVGGEDAVVVHAAYELNITLLSLSTLAPVAKIAKARGRYFITRLRILRVCCDRSRIRMRLYAM